MEIDSEHLQEWIADGRAVALSADVARNLVEHIERLPWNRVGTRLDWQVLDGVRADLARTSLAGLPEWIKSTAMRDDEYLVFVFDRDEPCLACASELGLTQIDYIYSGTPGVNYFFGAERRGGEIHPLPDHFAEYDGADRLVVKR